MIEAAYVTIGLLFGALGVWITTVGSLKESLKNESLKTAAMINENAVLLERINGINEKNKEKFELLERNKEQMRLEFKELADKILEKNSQKFSTQNQENISQILNPVREQFNEFKKQINDVYIKEAKERSMLQNEIKNIKEINHQMSQDAQNLTSALKGENKRQGIWGEMILERVLESSGLRVGFEYKREVTLEHENNGSRYRPDAIVHLPESRDIIIDAKTSLKAYEQYFSCEDEKQRELFAIEHITSIKKHIKELSQKDYINLKGIQTVDFVFMFIPVESALLMALEYDSMLFDHAFKKNIVLVSPTTLMVSLRAIENSWRYEKQQQNAQEIAKRAGLLFDKFSSFIESVERVGKQINTLQKSYDETFSKMHSGTGSITSQFKKLEQLGATTSKNLPEHILKQIEDE